MILRLCGISTETTANKVMRRIAMEGLSVLVVASLLAVVSANGSISGYLANAADFAASTNAQVNLKYTNVSQGSGAFSMGSDGKLTFLVSGAVSCQFSADVRIPSSRSYTTFTMNLNGAQWGRSLVTYKQDNDPEQWIGYFQYTVSANDYLTVTSNPSHITSIDAFAETSPGSHFSCNYVEGASTYVASSNTMSGSTFYFGTVKQNTNTAVFEHINGLIYFRQAGLVTAMVSTTGMCNDNNYCSTRMYLPQSYYAYGMRGYPSGNRATTVRQMRTVYVAKDDHFQLVRHLGFVPAWFSDYSIVSLLWTPVSGNTSDYTLRHMSNSADFTGSSYGDYLTIKYDVDTYTNNHGGLQLGAAGFTVSSGKITATRAGYMTLYSQIISHNKPVAEFASMRLLRDGIPVAGAIVPDGYNQWDQAAIAWHARVVVGTEFEFQLIPGQHSNLNGGSSWSEMTVRWMEGLDWDGVCYNGTGNDPSVELDRPVLVTPTISSNNYQLAFNADERFSQLKIVFGAEADNNACNFDSDTTVSSAYWTVTSDFSCTGTASMVRPAQDTLSTCAFARSDTATLATYTKTVAVSTKQRRSVTYQQAFRNFEYDQIKTTLFTVTVQVPFNVAVNSTGESVTGNITVLQAVSSTSVTFGSPYTVSFDLITSSQAPYKLSFENFTTTSDLGTSMNANSPDCADTAATTPCVQTFSFSALDIVTACPTKSTLSDAFSMTFNVGCKPSFTGNCLTPSPNFITVSFSLNSAPYCPQIEAVGISAELKTYKDVSLSSSTAWGTGSETSQFVVGSTVYGQVTVSVDNNAATFASTTIRTINTIGLNGASTLVYDSGTNIASVENGGGGVTWPSDNNQARLAVPLGQTSVALDGTLDAAQTVTLQAVLDVTYTTTNTGLKNELLSSWNDQHYGKGMALSSEVSNGLSSASATFSVAPPASTAPATPSSAAGGVAGMSTLSLVAVVCVLALLIVVGAFVAGKRNPAVGDEKAQQESLQLQVDTGVPTSDNLRSSSSAHVQDIEPEVTEDV